MLLSGWWFQNRIKFQQSAAETAVLKITIEGMNNLKTYLDISFYCHLEILLKLIWTFSFIFVIIGIKTYFSVCEVYSAFPIMEWMFLFF